MIKVLYVKSNSERAKEFQLQTVIYEENGEKFVKKQALCKEAIPHLKKMKDSYKKLSKAIINPRIKLAKIVDESENSLTFEFIDGVSFESRFNQAKRVGRDEIDKIIYEYEELLKNGFKTTKFDSQTMVGDEYRKIFGDIDYSEFDGELCFDGVSNIDLIFSNIIYSDDEIYLIDYEWVFELNMPVEYSIYRAFMQKGIEYDFIKEFEEFEKSFINGNVTSKNSFNYFQNNYTKKRLSIMEQLQEKDQQLQEKDQQLYQLNEVAQSMRIKNRVKKLFHKLSFKKSFEKPTKFNGNILKSFSCHSKKNDTLCIFAHYDKDGIIDDYVLNYIKHLNSCDIDIVFVSTALNFKDNYFELLSMYCRDIIVKDNIGYDFGSWKTGIEYIVQEFSDYDYLLICNDSVYAPLHNMASMIDEMKNRDIDFWGITNSLEIKPHLQSYFLFFNKNVFQSKVFVKFWKNYKVYKNKRNIIEKYEVGLTDILSKQGFNYDTYCDVKYVASGKKINITHHYWKDLITTYKCPIIKIELLRDNPVGVDIKDWSDVVSNTGYDINLIKNHLIRVK